MDDKTATTPPLASDASPSTSGPSPATLPVPPTVPEKPAKPAVAASGFFKQLLKSETPKEQPKGDTSREVAETIVFVVVLVLMLKAFVAEAFIIPTGSMATTLLGYHRPAKCDKCQHEFTVNASEESEGGWPQGRNEAEAICPLCRNHVKLDPRTFDGGDKVLVLKPLYDFGMPDRHDVIVFKFPRGPQENFAAKNYIKRLWLLPGETPSIWYGDVYKKVTVDGKEERQILRRPPAKLIEMRRLVSDSDKPSDVSNELKRWTSSSGAWTNADGQGREFTIKPDSQEQWLDYQNLYRAPALSAEAFARVYQRVKDINDILQRAPARAKAAGQELAKELQDLHITLGDVDVIAAREGQKLKDDRIAQGRALLVDHPSMKSLEVFGAAFQKASKTLIPNDAARKELGDVADTVETLKSDLANLAAEMAQTRAVALQPQLIVDMLGYNMGYTPSGFGSDRQSLLGGDNVPHWVRDLMLDCEVEVQDAKGQLTLEINGGVDQCQAVFDLANGRCTLSVTRHESSEAAGKVVATKSADTRVNKPGKYKVQMANVDDRVTLWVDGKLVFEDGMEYETIPHARSELRGPRVSDLKPIRIGVKNVTATVRHLQVWRDVYYTRDASANSSDFSFTGLDRSALGTAQFLSLDAKERKDRSPRAKVEKWHPYYQEHDPRDYRQLGPDEFFALGDNSTRSSDSRDWGAAPKRLLLGKAVWVYWPIWPIWPIWPFGDYQGRFGPIW